MKRHQSPRPWMAAGLTLLLLLTGCGSVKKTVYFQDIDEGVEQQIAQQYEVKIHQDDLLSIVVNSTNPELAVPFNSPRLLYHHIGIRQYLFLFVETLK